MASAIFLGAAPNFKRNGVAAEDFGINANGDIPDYIEDKYGIQNSVFQVTTVEYLDKLLTKTGVLEGTRTMNGTSLVVFADSTLETSQLAIPLIDTYAKAKGISKIYYVDMLLVGGEYDANVNIWDSETAADYWFKDHHSTTTTAGNATGAPSPAQTITLSPGNSVVTSSFIAMGLLIKLRMANISSGSNQIYPDSDIAAAPYSLPQDVADYIAATDTLLFSFTRTSNSAASVTSTALLAPSNLTAGAIINPVAYKALVDIVLDVQKNDSNGAITYSDYDFTRFDFGITYSDVKINGFTTNAAATFGDWGPNDFPVRVIPYYILRWLMEEAEGEHSIYIGGSWCGDSRAQYSIILQNLYKYDNVPVLWNFDFRMGGNMALTSTMLPAGYRSEDSTRWTSCVEDEGLRTAIAAGEDFMLDGVMQNNGDPAIALNTANASTNNRNVITRVVHLGMELCNLMAGGAFLPPVLGNHFTSTNLREQYLVDGVINDNGDGSGTYERARTSYKRFLSPHLFRFSSVEKKQVTQWSYLIHDWDLLRTGTNSDPGGYIFMRQDVYMALGGSGWTLDPEAAELDALGKPIIVRESDIGKYIDMENGGPFTNQQRAYARYTCSVFFGGEIEYSPQTPYYLTVNDGVNGAPKIKDDIDVNGGGCGGDYDPAKNQPNGPGQPLIPNQGTNAYDVLGNWDAGAPNKYGYDITIGFTGTLNISTVFNCTTIVTATANTALTSIALDFRKINVTSVNISINGATAVPATFTQQNNSLLDIQRLTVTNVSVAAGQEFAITVNYTLTTLDAAVSNAVPVEEYQGFTMHADGKGASALGEPTAAPYWFPCNNTPGDGATYRITLTSGTTPAYTKIGPGVLSTGMTGSETGASAVWQVKQPVATYQVFATFSSNITKISATGGTSATNNMPPYITADGRSIPYFCYVNTDQYLSNTAATRLRDKADRFFGLLPYYISTMEKLFGAYPGESIGFVFERLGDGMGAAMDTAIETKDRPFFSYENIVTEETFVHELAHQWFGDAVRMATWDDLWLNEGFATYATDLFFRHTTGWDPLVKWETVYNALGSSHLFWTGGAPANLINEAALFDGPRFAYYGGAMALSLLHKGLGDDVFFDVIQTWVSTYAGEAATTADFIAHAEGVSGADLTDWADAWLYGLEKPAAFVTMISSVVVYAPEKIELPVGYTDTYSPTFTFTGSPTPTITKIGGDDSITWDNTNNRVVIPAGLEPGIHTVKLLVSNGDGDDMILTFRILVGTELDLIESLQAQIDETIAALEDKLEAGDLDGINAELSRLAGLITALENAGYQTSSQVNTAIRAITDALTSRITAIETALAGGNLTAVNNQLTNLNNLISTLQGAGYQNGTQVNTAIKAITDGIESDISDIESRITLIESAIAAIEAEAAAQADKIAALEAELESLNGKNTAQDTKIKNLETSVEKLTADLDDKPGNGVAIFALILAIGAAAAVCFVIILGRKKAA